MTFQFYGYTLRQTNHDDLRLAIAWSKMVLQAGFWLMQGDGRESFLVTYRDQGIAFFQIQHVGEGDQVRLHWQRSPEVGAKSLLRALTMLVPLIEKGLALRGVKAIFFTSHSSSMARFMADRFGYTYAGDGGADGMMMSKGI